MTAFDAPFPVNLDLADRPVLVVGGGHVAARKVAHLRDGGAAVTVVAPAAVEEIAKASDVRWHRRAYRRGEAASYRVVITATDDHQVNSQVHRDAEAANVFVNSADDPANCSFTLPSVARRGDLQIAVSTNGRSPAFARWLRQQLETELDTHAVLLEILAEVRTEVRAEFGTSEVGGWTDALDDDLAQLVRLGEVDEARRRLRAHLGLASAAEDDQHEVAS